MKQLLSVLVITALLLLLSTTSAIAADKNFQVGLDYAVSSTIDTNVGGPNQKIDCTGYNLNGEYLVDRFKLGVNLGNIKLNDSDSETFNELNGGYLIADNIFVTLIYQNHSWTGGTTTANMVGVDASFPVGDKLSVGGNFELSLLGTSNTGSIFNGINGLTSTVTQYGLKILYQVSDSINVNLKYRANLLHYAAPGYPDQNSTYTWITLGAGFSF